ncbi:peptidoglycan DD-metalloendopeptidase family protein [Reichenbachiella versicolor]|uniref:peptidoglycan DD-metalloendopeptidase family protein n=1 Tax=Reichenbachiella versicolor TaxID=1821036 RepID=UPI000D6E5842|nr:peptidoglycan DD-metalloendopeptidase family protein [Reichenbachiella versicolor]
MANKGRKRLYSFGAATVIFAAWYFIHSSNVPNDKVTPELVIQDTVPQYVPKYYHGIIVDSLEVYEGVIKRNQNLANILNEYNVTDETLYNLSVKSKNVYDVRKFGSRKKYSILYEEKDSLKYATHFIYRPDPVNFVVFDIKDSIEIYKDQKEIEIKEKELAGDINMSLYVDMMENGGHVELVNEVAEIFGWEVDFFSVKKGDTYKIIYEEKYVDTTMVGIGLVKAAYFNHMGDSIYAFNFDQGDGGDYFDEEGESLRKTFLKAPLKFSRISSRYSGRRYHPVLKRWKSHLGTDYAAPRGTPIYAASDGIVTHARYKSNNGNYVKIKHNGNLATQYLHMSKIASGIKKGIKVKRGQTIGYVGSTGLATGPHLCYRFWQNGVQVDALKVKLPPAKPIYNENKLEFDSIRSVFTERLDQINIPDRIVEDLTASI